MGLGISVPYNGKKDDIPLSLVNEAAAAITINPGEIKIWTGLNPSILATPKVVIMNSFQTLQERLREFGYPTSAVVTAASIVPGAATSSAVVAEGAAPPVLTEDDIMFAYHQDYVSTGGRPAASHLFKAMFTKLWEVQLEALKFPP